jgi:hypothetical protein
MSKPSGGNSSSCGGGGGSDGGNNDPPSSLLQLATRIVAANIEKYPTAAWGVLSESQWDDIITERVVHSKNRYVLRHGSRTSSPFSFGKVTVLLPPISAKHLTQIEQHPNNTHLSNSCITDELLWKNIVNYKFRCSDINSSNTSASTSMNRPSSLRFPCTIVERQLVQCGETLLELVVNYKVISCADFLMQQQQQQQNEYHDRRSSVQSNSSLLFGDDDDDDDDDNDGDGNASLGHNLNQQHQHNDNEEEDVNQKKSEINAIQFSQYHEHKLSMSIQDMKRMQKICYTLSQSPMDIQLLANTKIGKIVTKVIKMLTKLKKRKEELDEEKPINFSYEEIWNEDNVDMRSIFWTQRMEWNKGPFIYFTSPVPSGKNVELTVLQFLQKLLLDWKDMASDNGVLVEGSSAPTAVAVGKAAVANSTINPPKKRQRLEEATQSSKKDSDQCNSSNKLDPSQNISVTTCGRDKHISIEQHTIDMTLLHSSPDWRSLYQSLTKRELELRKSHGEKVRATREHLERDRPKIGKVILKKAVGRVRGGDVGGGLLRSGSGGSGGGSSIESSMAQTSAAKASSTSPSFAMDKRSRQEAILNKSKGLRAIRKQASSGSGIASSKVTQIRQTSKVAAKWSKSSFNDGSSKSFGASVASAAGGGGVRKVMQKKDQSQIHVSLQNGKTMKLPSTASTAAGKSSGKYSSLQQKMAAKNRGVKRK